MWILIKWWFFEPNASYRQVNIQIFENELYYALKMYMKNEKDDVYLCKLDFVIETKPNNDVLYHMIKEVLNKNL